MFTGLKSITSVVRVLGAPAAIRGVTAINLGFTNVALNDDIKKEALLIAFENSTGILDTDVQVYCWPVVEDNVLPLIELQVTREEADFKISFINALDFYPVFPTSDDITTTVDVYWSGTPVFPVTYQNTAITCYVGWTCYDSEYVIDTVNNPLSRIFGCFSSDTGGSSGFITYQIVLTDSTGKKTAPGTYTFCCGEGNNRSIQTENSDHQSNINNGAVISIPW